MDFYELDQSLTHKLTNTPAYALTINDSLGTSNVVCPGASMKENSAHKHAWCVCMCAYRNI